MAKKKNSKRRGSGVAGDRGEGPRPAAGPRGIRSPEGEPRSGRRTGTARLAAGGVAILLVAAGLYHFVFSRRTTVRRESGLNVLLITLDTTRADRLGCYGYTRARTPNLDALAHGGVRFENVYCQVPLTLPSHCSIMTGTYPFTHNVRDNGTHVLGADQLTMAKTLKQKGYRTGAVVASFSVDSRFGLNQGFDSYDDNIQPGMPFKPMNSERKGDEVAKLFSAWLDKEGSEPFFAWVHLFDPHLPYQPPSPFKEEFADTPYDGEIAFMDVCLGRVIDKLREKNLLGRTLVAVCGDHGEAFGERVETGHGLFLYDDTLRVPLLFYSEGRLPAGRVVGPRVRLIDVFPTIMDLLGSQPPAKCQGTSLVPYIEGRRRGDLDAYIETFYPREYFGWSELVGLIHGNWKYIRAPKSELYDLGADPGEQRNLFTTEGAVAKEMNQRLEELIKANAGIPFAKGRAMTPEEEERLRSLGYTSFAGSGVKSDYPDPKDKVDLLRLIQQAQAFDFEGRFQEAVDTYKRLLPLIPDAPSSYVNLALAQARLKKFDETIATLRQGIAHIPNSIVLLSRLGHTYLVSGRLEEAYQTMSEVLKLDPKYVEALTVCAVVLDSSHRVEEARGFYERALAVEPKSKFLRSSYATNLAASGFIDRTIDVYKKLTEDYPDDPAMLQLLGIAYGAKGDYEAAIDRLKQAIILRPTPTAYYNLAVAYRKKGDIRQAAQNLELYLADPKDENPADVEAARAELARLKKGL